MIELSRVRLIARREVLSRLARRSFVVSSVIQVLFVALLALIPILAARFSHDHGDDVPTSKVVVADPGHVVDAGTLQAVIDAASKNAVSIDLSTAENADAARSAVKDKDADAALLIEKGSGTEPTFTVVTRNGKADGVTGQTLSAVATALTMQQRISAFGLTPQQVQDAYASPKITSSGTDSGSGKKDSDERMVRYALSYIGVMTLFFAIVLYGNWIAQGVVEEKSSRIMEIMINAATPRDLLAGKVLGILGAALLQFGPMLLVGTLILGFQRQLAKLAGVDPDRLINVNFGKLASTSLLWVLLFFFLGFFLYGALFAGVGSLVSRQEEVSTAIAPMTTLMMLGYAGAFAALSKPDSTLARIAFLFPLTSPFAGVPRVLLGHPSMAERLVGVALLALAVLAAIWFASRLYRIGVLMYGQRPGWRSLLRASGLQTVTR